MGFPGYQKVSLLVQSYQPNAWEIDEAGFLQIAALKGSAHDDLNFPRFIFTHNNPGTQFHCGVYIATLL